MLLCEEYYREKKKNRVKKDCVGAGFFESEI